MNKKINCLKIILYTIGLSYCAIYFKYAFQHPEKTQTQLFFDMFNGNMYRWK